MKRRDFQSTFMAVLTLTVIGINELQAGLPYISEKKYERTPEIILTQHIKHRDFGFDTIDALELYIHIQKRDNLDYKSLTSKVCNEGSYKFIKARYTKFLSDTYYYYYASCLNLLDDNTEKSKEMFYKAIETAKENRQNALSTLKNTKGISEGYERIIMSIQLKIIDVQLKESKLKHVPEDIEKMILELPRGQGFDLRRYLLFVMNKNGLVEDGRRVLDDMIKRDESGECYHFMYTDTLEEMEGSPAFSSLVATEILDRIRKLPNLAEKNKCGVSL